MNQYSASMVSCLFWLQETRKTAELMSQGLSLSEIRKLAVAENIYQVRADDRASRIAGVTYKRMIVLSDELREKFIASDIATAKLILLVAIMKTDLLFYEFMHTSFKQAIILGARTLLDSMLTVFFDTKSTSSEEVKAFSESAIKKLKQTYVKVLVEAGILASSKDKTILTPMIDYRLYDAMKAAGMLPYLTTLTGEEYHD